MANTWIESYLDALLSFGLSNENLHLRKSEKFDKVANEDRNRCAQYYVQQILDLNETELWQAWRRMRTTKNSEDRDRRLEFLTWRVWYMKQNKSQIPQRQRTSEDTNDDQIYTNSDASSVASEINEDSNDDASFGNTKPQNFEVNSPTYTEPSSEIMENRVDKLYLVLVSLHGLVRGEGMELGRDADTGGQVKYVVELARALSCHPMVHRVDLLTRLIEDPRVDGSYGQPCEVLKPGINKNSGVFLIRIPCGDRKQYIRKEELWPHMREFADRSLSHVKKVLGELYENGEPCDLYCIHGHYADGGEVAGMIASTLGVDMVFTGHSLGRNKFEHLIKTGKMTKSEIDKTYNIFRRIEAEERVLDQSIMVFTSTKQEIIHQWGLYHGYSEEMEQIIHRRKGVGYHIPAMRVIPPGLELNNMRSENTLESPKEDFSFDFPSSGASAHETGDPPFWKEIFKFLQNPRKPAVLLMARPDVKKNITMLLKVFGSNQALRELANLVLIMGSREIIDSMAKSSKNVIIDILKLIDTYDLYGSVAYPKRHEQTDIADIYNFAYATKGTFVNIALQEPFGMTLIEAASFGVPIVATENGGPVDIINTLQNGILVDPSNQAEITEALLKILTQRSMWEDFSCNGLKRINAYSWEAHCERYLCYIDEEKKNKKMKAKAGMKIFSGSFDQSQIIRILKDEMNSGDGTFKDDLLLSLDDNAFDQDLRARMAEEEKEAGQPRVAIRKKLIVFTFDNTESAKEAIKIAKPLIRSVYGFNSNRRKKSDIGFGISSMLSFDTTFSLLEDAKLKIHDIDFMILNAGADLLVWMGRDEMNCYEPYEVHIDNNWDKIRLLRALKSMWKDRKKEVTLVSEVEGMITGLYQVVKKISPNLETIDNVEVLERVITRLRNTGIRVNTVLQVDNTTTGKEVAPLLHFTPLYASRSLALRFLTHRLGIDMENVSIFCFPASIDKNDKPQEESMKISFAVSDIDSIIGGSQKVFIVPPSENTMVREARDKLDEKMIEKMQMQCGRDIFGDRVVIYQDEMTQDFFNSIK